MAPGNADRAMQDSDGGLWHDWLIARLLFQEAERLLNTPAPAGQ